MSEKMLNMTIGEPVDAIHMKMKDEVKVPSEDKDWRSEASLFKFTRECGQSHAETFLWKSHAVEHTLCSTSLAIPRQDGIYRLCLCGLL